MNILNSDYLKNQIDTKRVGRLSKMNDHEYALNQELLLKIKSSPRNNDENNFNNQSGKYLKGILKLKLKISLT